MQSKKLRKLRKTRKGGARKIQWGPNARPTNVYGTNFSNPPTQHNLNLKNSRKSTSKTPRYEKTPLTPQNAKVFANLWASYNDPKNMIMALEHTNLNEAGKNRVLSHIIYLGDDIIRGK